MSPAPDPSAWDLLATHRDALLRIARRRASTPEAAEDAVQEALTRAVARWDVIDKRQLGGWLAVVTMNLCADEQRSRARERRALPRLFHATSTDPGDVVAERLEDDWVVAQVADLPDRQQMMLHAVADEGGVPAAAHRMGVSRQSAESLLKRARASLRARVAVTLGALGLGGWRRGKVVGAGGAAAGLAAVSLGLIATVPAISPWSSPHPQQPKAGAAAGTNDLRSAATVGAVRRDVPSRKDSRRAAATTARATPTGAPNKVIVPPRDYDIGPGRYHDGGETVEHRGHTMREEVQNCIDRGIEISTTYIGCRWKPGA